MKLRWHIFLVAFALGIIPLLTLVGINLKGHIKRHEVVVLHQAEARQNFALINLNAEINHYRQILQALAMLPEVRKIVNSEVALLPSPELIALLNTWFAEQNAIRAITISNQDGHEKLALLRNKGLFQPTPTHNKIPATDELLLVINTNNPARSGTAYFLIDANIFLAKYHDSLWIDPAGAYLHQPASSNMTTTPGSNALEDFPGLRPLLNQEKALLWESGSGETITWMPVILADQRPSLWIGTKVDRSAALEWKRSLIRNIITITLTMAALIFLIANGIAKKVDSIKEQILTGLDQVMNHNQEFNFNWTGPAEITTMAEDLSQLAQQYVKTSRAREEAEAALRENQENFTNLADSAQDAIVLMDHHGNISYWNQTAEEMFGYKSLEVIGKPIHPLISPRLLEDRTSEPVNNHATTAEPIRETIELITKKSDGSDLPVELSLSEARIKDKWHSIWLIRDISERKQAEKKDRLHQRQLIQADKMASLGLLVSGMAHEINNPNSIALLNTPMLAKAWTSISPILERYYTENGDFQVAGLEYSEMREQIPQLFKELEESSKRIRAIVKDLKDYARQDNTRAMKLIDINEIARAATRLTGNLLKKSTKKFTERYGDKLPPIRCNSQRLEQVVINLLQNSCDALPDNEATLTIETGLTGDGQQIYLQVEDEGCGIPAESLNRVTDPFFTTKRSSGGTGLGLSVSAGIIKEHGGRINFASNDRHTTVTIILPIAETDTDRGEN